VHKLLIIDDDESMRRLLKTRLSANYEVIETGQPAQAVELALAHKPDAILMDLMMPNFSGFELSRGLRDLSYTSRIPIFIVSGESANRCREHCERLGAVDYFQKPVDFKRLQARLLEELQKQRSERRGSVRVRMKVSLRLRGIDVSGCEFEELTHTENVSVDGFLCQCTASLARNSIVEVFIAAGHEKYNHAGTARVVRRADPDTPWQKYGFQFQTRTTQWVLQPT
jgi:twitching motility two-component system response regulator PilH